MLVRFCVGGAGRRVRSGGRYVWRGLSTRSWPSLFPTVGERAGNGALSRWSGGTVRHHDRGTPLLAARTHSGHLPRSLRIRLRRQRSLETPLSVAMDTHPVTLDVVVVEVKKLYFAVCCLMLSDKMSRSHRAFNIYRLHNGGWQRIKMHVILPE